MLPLTSRQMGLQKGCGPMTNDPFAPPAGA